MLSASKRSSTVVSHLLALVLDQVRECEVILFDTSIPFHRVPCCLAVARGYVGRSCGFGWSLQTGPTKDSIASRVQGYAQTRTRCVRLHCSCLLPNIYNFCWLDDRTRSDNFQGLNNKFGFKFTNMKNWKMTTCFWDDRLMIFIRSCLFNKTPWELILDGILKSLPIKRRRSARLASLWCREKT